MQGNCRNSYRQCNLLCCLARPFGELGIWSVLISLRDDSAADGPREETSSPQEEAGGVATPVPRPAASSAANRAPKTVTTAARTPGDRRCSGSRVELFGTAS